MKAVAATIRESDSDTIMIEVRFSDGQKFVAIEVDTDLPDLAQEICDWINTRNV